MVLDVVSIIESSLIEVVVDGIVGQMIVALRLGRVDEDVLRPIS